jgi:hypothetical protein
VAVALATLAAAAALAGCSLLNEDVTVDTDIDCTNPTHRECSQGRIVACNPGGDPQVFVCEDTLTCREVQMEGECVPDCDAQSTATTCAQGFLFSCNGSEVEVTSCDPGVCVADSATEAHCE